MQVVEFPLTSASVGSFRVHTISESDRARTSAPGLRAFVKIADRLGLNGTERIAILGHPARSTYYRWIKISATYATSRYPPKDFSDAWHLQFAEHIV